MREIENIPNVKFALDALRAIPYSTEQAIEDLLDNSLDAKAKNIHVMIDYSKHSITSIRILDDGFGMDDFTLKEALKLGSNTNKDEKLQLGKFGTGLNSASTSQGQVIKVITKENNSKILSAIQDLREMEKKGKWIKLQGPSPKMDEDFFNRFAPNSNFGTIIEISELDRCEWSRGNDLIKALRKKNGETFRKMIQKGIANFWIGGKKTEAIDPIFDHNPILLGEHTIDKGIKIRCYELENFGNQENKDRGIGISGQGIYTLRNDRQIQAAETFNLWKKHNDYNRFRCELLIEGNVTGISVNKTDFKPTEKQKEEIKKVIEPYMSKLREDAQAKLDKKKKDVDFSLVEKKLNKLKKLGDVLNGKEGEVEKRESNEKSKKVNPSEGRGPDKNPRKKRVPKKTQGTSIADKNFKWKFRISGWGEDGPIYIPEVSETEDIIYIDLNADHIFYSNHLFPLATNKALVDQFLASSLMLGARSIIEILAIEENEEAESFYNEMRQKEGEMLKNLLSG